jgi:hypothetical protein
MQKKVPPRTSNGDDRDQTLKQVLTLDLSNCGGGELLRTAFFKITQTCLPDTTRS